MAKFFIQNLFEYVFDYFSKKGTRFLFDRLNREDYLKVKSNSKIKRFIEGASLNDLIAMCSKVGLRVALTMWDEDDEKTKKVENVFTAYLDVPSHELPKILVKGKVFATMDIDFIRSLMYASKASHSSQYSLNRKYLEVRDKSKVLRTRTLVNKLETENNVEWYINTIQFALNLEPVLEVFSIDLDQFKILMFLHNCPNGAMKDVIRTKIEKTGKTTLMLNNLRSMNMVRYDPRNEDIISIGTYGIVVLDQIISKFP